MSSHSGEATESTVYWVSQTTTEPGVIVLAFLSSIIRCLDHLVVPQTAFQEINVVSWADRDEQKLISRHGLTINRTTDV